MNQTPTSTCNRCGKEIDFSCVYCSDCVLALNAAQDTLTDVPCMRCSRPIRKNALYCNELRC